MPDEKNILKDFDRLKNGSQFDVPDGYFDNLPGRIMANIKSHEEKKGPQKIWALIKPQLKLVASFAALFLLAYTGFKLFIPSKNSGTLPEKAIVATLESEIYDMDDSEIIDVLEPQKPEPTIDNADLTKNDIMEYLMEDGSDLDLSLTE